MVEMALYIFTFGATVKAGFISAFYGDAHSYTRRLGETQYTTFLSK